MKKILVGLLVMGSISSFAGNFSSPCEENYSDLAYHCYYKKKSGSIGDKLKGQGSSLYLKQAKDLAQANCEEQTGEKCEFVFCGAAYGHYQKVIIPGGSQTQGGHFEGKKEWMKQVRKDKEEFKRLRNEAKQQCPRS